MFTINGKYSDAKVFTDLCEQEAVNQIQTLLDQPFAAGAMRALRPTSMRVRVARLERPSISRIRSARTWWGWILGAASLLPTWARMR